MPIDYEAIYRDPEFINMVRRRRRICYSLSAIMTLIFILYMGAMAYARDWLASSLLSSGGITVGMVLTVGIILISILMSGYYIWWANRHFDRLRKTLLERLDHE